VVTFLLFRRGVIQSRSQGFVPMHGSFNPAFLFPCLRRRRADPHTIRHWHMDMELTYHLHAHQTFLGSSQRLKCITLWKMGKKLISLASQHLARRAQTSLWLFLFIGKQNFCLSSYILVDELGTFLYNYKFPEDTFYFVTS
jgi:hypothetical protein